MSDNDCGLECTIVCRHEKACSFLCLRHFLVASIVFVVFKNSLLYNYVGAHHLINNDWIDNTVNNLLLNLIFKRLRVNVSFLDREVEGTFS